jgi:ATP:corrinoid adenosyltransferase
MQRKKEYIDFRIDQANIDKGIIVLLTGNGKGKSSSAMGMICRALGYDMKVALVRYLKRRPANRRRLVFGESLQYYFLLIWRVALLGILKTRSKTR